MTHVCSERQGIGPDELYYETVTLLHGRYRCMRSVEKMFCILASAGCFEYNYNVINT